MPKTAIISPVSTIDVDKVTPSCKERCKERGYANLHHPDLTNIAKIDHRARVLPMFIAHFYC